MKKRAKIRPLWFALFFGALSVVFIMEALSAKGLDYFLPFVGWGGTFKYTNLRLMGLPIYYVTILVGLAIAVALCLLRRKREGMPTLTAVLFPIAVLAVCLVGGKLLYILENLDSVLKNGVGLDGFSLFGAIFLTVIAAFLLGGFKQSRVAYLLDHAIYIELILLAAVRTGCFLNGCCGAPVSWHGSNPVIIPVQLIEVFFDLIIFDICLKIRDSKGPDGRMFPVFLIGYALVRFILEFMRKNPKTLLFLTNGQLFSLIGILLGVVLYLYFSNRLKKT